MDIHVQQLISLFRNYKIGFVSVKGYTNRYGEVSNRTVNIGFNYGKIQSDDLKSLNEGIEYIESDKYTREDWDNAIVELKQSCVAPDTVRSEGQKSAYINITPNGAIKYHVEKQRLYIDGLLLEGSKKILTEGNYPTVNSRPKTIAKRVIEKNYLRRATINRFVLDRLPTMNMNGLEIPNDLLELTT